MTVHAKVALLAVAHFLAFSQPASAAESVFRCGNSYSQVPCAQGTVISVDDSRSDSQRAAAAEVAAREAKLAAQMTRDRQQAEALAAVTRPRPARAKKSVASALAPTRRAKGNAPGSEEKNFVAFVPKPAKKAAVK